MRAGELAANCGCPAENTRSSRSTDLKNDVANVAKRPKAVIRLTAALLPKSEPTLHGPWCEPLGSQKPDY